MDNITVSLVEDDFASDEESVTVCGKVLAHFLLSGVTKHFFASWFTGIWHQA
jgi:hypothetical protein